MRVVSSPNATHGVEPENEFSKTFYFLQSIYSPCVERLFLAVLGMAGVNDLPLRFRDVRKIERQKTNSTNLSYPRIALCGFQLFRYISRVNEFASAGFVDLSTCIIIYYYRYRSLYI